MSTPLNVPPKSNSSTLATDKKVGDNTVSSKGDDTEVTSNFIRDIIEADLKSGKHGNAVTRFPPEPNGFLHIGHAKSICLNFGIARDYKGVCHLRFDDTNPIKEDTKYVDAIKEDVRWLGFDWGDNLFYSSDYFERLYDAAVTLISKGQAYVCGQTDDQMRATRGTVKEAGTASPDRNRAVKENLDLFARMRQGEFKDGEYTLRAKGDMSAANMKLRDWPLYRIRHTEHHRTGSTWCIYPLYDFAHCISDAIEGVTHSLCTLEFENNRALYEWILSHLDFTNPPKQTEFARLNLTYTIMSKRNLLTLVEEGLVNGWDDPRMPTIAGLRRRGVTPEAIRNFCDRIGMAKANSTVDVAQLDFSIRDDLNTKTPRVLAVLDPVKLVITNYPTTADCPQGETDWLDANYYPHDIPLEGTRKLPFTRELYIERSDFMEVPVRKYFRLAPGKEVRLRYGYLVTCTDVVKDAAGEITEIHCTYDPDSRGGNAPDGRKVKGTIHWVSAEHALDAEVRLYDRLFNVEAPGAGDTDFREQLNPDSLKTVTAKVEPSLASCKPSDRFQFERTGYFCSDSKDSSPDHLVFNRTVPLRDSWGKKKG